MLTIRSTVWNWMLEFDNHYELSAGLDIKFIVAHTNGETKYSITPHRQALVGDIAEEWPLAVR